MRSKRPERVREVSEVGGKKRQNVMRKRKFIFLIFQVCVSCVCGWFAVKRAENEKRTNQRKMWWQMVLRVSKKRVHFLTCYFVFVFVFVCFCLQIAVVCEFV